jgi:hypothetical protein
VVEEMACYFLLVRLRDRNRLQAGDFFATCAYATAIACLGDLKRPFLYSRMLMAILDDNMSRHVFFILFYNL